MITLSLQITLNSITLNWDDTESFTNYTVQRSLNGSSWTTITATQITKNYIDAYAFNAYSTYYYKIINNDTSSFDTENIVYMVLPFAYISATTLITNVPTPTIAPNGGTYTTPQYVILDDSLIGASIYYTLDGTTPTILSTLYTTAITISENKIIKAIGIYTGIENSNVAIANFYISTVPRVSTPIITPNSYSYINETHATITCGDVGATIYYTLDGTDPTILSSVYSSPIPIGSGSKIKAFAVFLGKTDSFIAIADYSLTKHMPLILQTNKITTENSGENQRYKYSSFDNSNVSVYITKPTDNENDLTIKIENSLVANYKIKTPISTNRKLLKVEDIDFYNTGDVLMLDISNVGKTYYDQLVNNKWIIKAKFRDSEIPTDNYLVLNDNYPTEKLNSITADDNYSFKLYDFSCIIMLNSLRLRGNPVMETEQTYSFQNQASIDKFKKQSYVVDGAIVNIDTLKYILSYFDDGYAGLDTDSTKFLVPFELPNRIDIELLDIIRLKDDIYTKFNNEPVIIISKQEDSNSISTKYIGMTIGNNIPNSKDIQFNSVINYLPANTPTYSHIEDSDVAKVLNDTGQDIISVQLEKYGLITANKLLKADFSGTINSTYNANANNITIALTGTNVPKYVVSMASIGTKSIIKIDNEFILIESTSIVTSTSTSFNANILVRDLFAKGKTNLTSGKSFEFYNILMAIAGTSLTIAGTINVTGVNGQINFVDSGLILDDYKKSEIRLADYSGITLKDSVTSSEYFKVIKGDFLGIGKATEIRISNGSDCSIIGTIPEYSYIQGQKFANNDDFNLVNSKPMKIMGLVVGNETEVTLLTPVNGSMRYNTVLKKFQGYEDGVWKTFSTT